MPGRSDARLAGSVVSGSPSGCHNETGRAVQLAAENADRRVVVLPWHRPNNRERWQLKLHGDVRHPDEMMLARRRFARFNADREAGWRCSVAFDDLPPTSLATPFSVSVRAALLSGCAPVIPFENGT
jgi:hypothetical protein